MTVVIALGPIAPIPTRQLNHKRSYMLPTASDSPLIDGVFNLCVWLLLFVGRCTGLSYNTINVLVFCVVWPAITLALGVLAFRNTKRQCTSRPTTPSNSNTHGDRHGLRRQGGAAQPER
jgi:hypothetical protein